MTKKLDACPFCGAQTATLDSSSGSDEVVCGTCHAYTWGSSLEEAALAWNRREHGFTKKDIIELIEARDTAQHQIGKIQAEHEAFKRKLEREKTRRAKRYTKMYQQRKKNERELQARIVELRQQLALYERAERDLVSLEPGRSEDERFPTWTASLIESGLCFDADGETQKDALRALFTKLDKMWEKSLDTMPCHKPNCPENKQ